MSISELVAIVAVVTTLITAAIALRRAPGEARKSAAETRKLNEDAEQTSVETQATIHKMVLDELDRVIVERDRVRAEHYNDVESLRKLVDDHETERGADRAHIKSLSETVVSLKLQIEGLTESNRQQVLDREAYEKNLAEFVVAISHMQIKAAEDDKKIAAYGKQVREYEARIGVLEARIEALEEENVKLIVKRGSE